MLRLQVLTGVWRRRMLRRLNRKGWLEASGRGVRSMQAIGADSSRHPVSGTVCRLPRLR